jgi:hypothetical protein
VRAYDAAVLAYVDCSGGVAGDILLAALIDCGLPLTRLEAVAAALGLEGEVRLVARDVRAGSFRAKRLDVIAATRRRRTVRDMLDAVGAAALPERVREQSARTIERLAEVEARLHDVPRDELHLHELSGVDTLVDIVGFHAGLDALGITKLHASAVNVGGGRVTFSHGTFGVPAPATAELLRGVPTHGDSVVEQELTTPTGAAILVTAASAFGPMPRMTVRTIGYAVGARELPEPRILRLFLGDLAE